MLNNIILAIIGLASGFAVASGIFAFIMSLGIVERMADVTQTAQHIMLYETIVLAGAVSGNILSIYHINMPTGSIGMAIIGLFSGVFTGMVAIALIEILESIPIMFRRNNLHRGLSIVILCIAFGKLFGSLIQFAKGWSPQ